MSQSSVVALQHDSNTGTLFEEAEENSAFAFRGHLNFGDGNVPVTAAWQDGIRRPVKWLLIESATHVGELQLNNSKWRAPDPDWAGGIWPRSLSRAEWERHRQLLVAWNPRSASRALMVRIEIRRRASTNN